MEFDLFGLAGTIWITEKIGNQVADVPERFDASRAFVYDVLDSNTSSGGDIHSLQMMD
jgi:hypothetical protein